MQRWFNDAFIARGGDAAVRRAAARRRCRRVGDAFERDGGDRYRAATEEIKVPTLCLVGEPTSRRRRRWCKAIADAIPGARFTVHPRRPHMPFIEIPDEVAKVVGGFFKDVLN